MIKNPYPGKLIVFEGLDGSGTTTQANLLLKYLKNKNKKVYLTSEPTHSLIGGIIESQISGDWKSSPECLQLLFTADRAYHLEKEIIPLLKKRIIVICVRYLLSTLAYGALEIKDEKWLREINKKFILPDLTFLLKVSPKICIQRIKKERFHKELFEKENKLRKIFKNYLRLAKKFKNIYIINGEKPIEEVAKEIQSIVSGILTRN
ncbi:MAG: dTMP kinase [Patescibacteria group bacterium]|nr:dTMP kinase [Patescibacteria group bacterium]